MRYPRLNSRAEKVLYQVLVSANPTKWEPVADLATATKVALWGTFGKGGVEHCNGTCPDHPLVWKKLIDCDTEHLLAILDTQPQVRDTCYVEIIKCILADRGVCSLAYPNHNWFGQRDTHGR